MYGRAATTVTDPHKDFSPLATHSRDIHPSETTWRGLSAKSKRIYGEYQPYSRI